MEEKGKWFIQRDKKICLLPVPKAAAAYGWQLTILRIKDFYLYHNLNFFIAELPWFSWLVRLPHELLLEAQELSPLPLPVCCRRHFSHCHQAGHYRPFCRTSPRCPCCYHSRRIDKPLGKTLVIAKVCLRCCALHSARK